MKIILNDGMKNVKTIKVAPEHLKALKITAEDPYVYLEDKINRILVFTTEQVVHKYAENKLRTLKGSEMAELIEEIRPGSE